MTQRPRDMSDVWIMRWFTVTVSSTFAICTAGIILTLAFPAGER